MNEAISRVVERVVDATVRRDIERETWERAFAVQGLLDAGVERGVKVAHAWIDQAVRLQDSSGHLNYNDWETHQQGHIRGQRLFLNSLGATFGYHAVRRFEETRVERYLEAARRQANAILDTPRTSDGGLSLLADSVELWIDSLALFCPFLARLSAADADEALADEVARQFEVHLEHLFDPAKHLARHAWKERPDHFPQSAFWSRGNGWLAMATVDSVAWLGVERLAGAVDAFRQQMEAVLDYRDASGLWRNTLDDPHARLEVSGSLMFSYAMCRAAELGILGAEVLPLAAHTFETVTGIVDAEGVVRGVAVPPGGPGVDFGMTSFGQGFYLMTAAALDRHGALPDFRPIGS